MKPQKHKTSVRIFCLVVAVLMILEPFLYGIFLTSLRGITQTQ